MSAKPRPVPPPTKGDELPKSPLLTWFRPTEPVDMIISGACGAAILELSRELRRVECFVRAGIDPPSRVLFYGPSGTGKTLAARWLARKLGIPIAIINVGGIISSYIGASAKQLVECFALTSSNVREGLDK